MGHNQADADGIGLVLDQFGHVMACIPVYWGVTELETNSSTEANAWHICVKSTTTWMGQNFMRPWMTSFHDDVIKRKHLTRYWPFVRGIHRWLVNSPHKGQRRGTLMFFFHLCLNKRLSKQSWGWWFETSSRSLWRHCNARLANHSQFREIRSTYMGQNFRMISQLKLKSWTYEILWYMNMHANEIQSKQISIAKITS